MSRGIAAAQWALTSTKEEQVNMGMGSRAASRIAELLRADITAISRLLARVSMIDVVDYVDVAAAGATTLLAATAMTVSPQTILAAGLVAGGKTAIAAVPRRLRFTTGGATPADAPATVVITGTDVDGNVLTETVNLAQTATTADSTKFFSTITSLAFAAADGASSTVSVGFTDAMGFPFLPKLRGGGPAVVRELLDGVAPATAATMIAPASGAPYGGFTPNSVPNAARDYTLYVEADY